MRSAEVIDIASAVFAVVLTSALLMLIRRRRNYIHRQYPPRPQKRAWGNHARPSILADSYLHRFHGMWHSSFADSE
jgi:hypothetical protein